MLFSLVFVGGGGNGGALLICSFPAYSKQNIAKH